MATKKEEAAQSGGAVTTTEQATALQVADNSMFAAHAGAGLENVGAKDILIPRLSILQKLSPQLDAHEALYNPAAKEGDIYDVGLGEVIGQEMMFIPLVYQKQWLEWAPRNTGKGLVKIWDDDRIMEKTEPNDKGKPILANGNYIAETAQFYGLNITSQNRLSFIPMASTQLKKARQLLTLSTSEKLPGANGSEFTPPLFYRVYRFSTVPESNSEGKWIGWKIERGPALTELEGWKDLFDRMLVYNGQIQSGAAKADMTGMEGEVSQQASSNDADKM